MVNAMRHTELYDPADYADKRVALIGVGTIGSHTALTLARMSVPFTMYDHDTIEEHNIATQAYTRRDIGRYKVDAVLKQCEDIGAEEGNVVAVPSKYEARELDAEQDGESVVLPDIIVSCVDSIDARREIAQAIIASGITTVIMDARVGAEQVEVYRYYDAEDWLAELPAQADTDPCGARFTAYTANICAGLLANNIKRELLGQPVVKRILYDAVSSTFIAVR
jgi:molybdopterin/thiamine biosynthesis adenylyltransferase